MLINLTLLSKPESPESLIYYVKSIKNNTDMGLREAKYFCDMTLDNIGKTFKLEVTDYNGLISDLSCIDVLIEDQVKSRKKVFIELGMSCKSDLIDVLSTDISLIVYNKNFYSIKPIFVDILQSMEEEHLSNLYQKLKSNHKF